MQRDRALPWNTNADVWDHPACQDRLALGLT